MTDSRLFIGGERVTPEETAEEIQIRAAATGDHLATVAEATSDDVDAAVGRARDAFDDPSGWSHWPPERRATALRRLADSLEARGGKTAELVSVQAGMPISVARVFDGSVPSSLLRYYAALITQTPEREERTGIPRGVTTVRSKPAGVVAVVAPWNFPQVTAFFKLAPALAAGCSVVIKPSPETVLDEGPLADAVIEAQIPPGVINIVPGGKDVGAYLIAHPGVDMVSFTGSTDAGRKIGAACGELLRPVTLELGGKSAAIVLDDADLVSSAQEMFAASFLNNGQTCFASTRILAPRSRYAEVVDFYTEMANGAKIGDPLSEDTQIGPLVSARQRRRVEEYVAKGLAGDARLTTGGGRPRNLSAGWFMEPTIFADVSSKSVLAQEEIFGPVLTITPYEDEADAVALANDSEYGLAGTVWTTDTEHGLAVAEQVDTGTIGVNGYLPDIGSPYGGVKNSGLGRELGPEGLRSYQYVQSTFRI